VKKNETERPKMSWWATSSRQYIFPFNRLSTDPYSGIILGHHLDPSQLQRAMRAAVILEKIDKPVSLHTFRHCFSMHLLEAG
jgi:integrase